MTEIATETAAVLEFPGPALDDLSRQPTDKLVDLAASLKAAQSRLAGRLRQASLILAERCEFAAGSKTGRLTGRNFQARIQLKERAVWNQELLENARAIMGDDDFFQVFKWTFEPRSARRLEGALLFGQRGDLLRAARSLSPAPPQVTFEKLQPQAA